MTGLKPPDSPDGPAATAVGIARGLWPRASTRATRPTDKRVTCAACGDRFVLSHSPAAFSVLSVSPFRYRYNCKQHSREFRFQLFVDN
ncbi:hypothetical protein MTO96_048274 [Rhipicephalus appendiculatus]